MNDRHLDPPEEDLDEDRIDEAMATDQAREEIDQTPYSIAWWLLEECGDDLDPLDAYSLRRAFATGSRELSVPELVIVAFNEVNAEEIARAVLELRAKFREATEDVVADRANDLLRQQEDRDIREAELAFGDDA